MAAQLFINPTTPKSLKQMSTAASQYDYTTYQVLNTFASSSTGVGTVSVNPANTTGLTAIGTFTDTYRPYDQNQHPIGTDITSVVYTFYQDLGTATESLTRPIEYDSGLKEQNDTSLNADSISIALANLVSSGLGSYALQPTTPVGGTWTALSTITNNLDTNESNVTYLWRKTAASAPTETFRPLKINATSPLSLKEMSDAEIQTLTARLRNRIVATGIGKYAIQSTTPVGGTWVTAGSAFNDTTRTSSSIGYSGTYVGSYLGTYTGNYTNSFTGVYTGSFTGAYSRVFTGVYTGTYAGGYVGPIGYNGFIGPGTTTYTGFYSGGYTGNYTGTFTGIYSRGFTGVYSRVFTGSYTGSYTGNYSGTYTGLTLNNDTSTVSTIYLWVRTA